MSIKKTTTVIRTCDRCGVESEKMAYSSPFWRERMTLSVSSAGRDSFGNGAKSAAEYELCAKCADAFRVWMKDGSESCQTF